VGFFGGSFDPIHFGHLNLAVELLEKGGLDEILFCPAFCSPFKTDRPPIASAQDRYRMIEAVVADLPFASVTSIEIERKGPSFTVETLRKLQREGVQYRLILSAEAAASFEKWREPEEILRLASLLVGARKGAVGECIQTSLFEISSTEIRARLKKKLYCGHLIPHKALDYIERNGLYSPK
jgi:nicotinate-nucleotide adenylyltransferase